eukprot:754518-Hanusia_phi.AAC.1
MEGFNQERRRDMLACENQEARRFSPRCSVSLAQRKNRFQPLAPSLFSQLSPPAPPFSSPHFSIIKASSPHYHRLLHFAPPAALSMALFSSKTLPSSCLRPPPAVKSADEGESKVEEARERSKEGEERCERRGEDVVEERVKKVERVEEEEEERVEGGERGGGERKRRKGEEEEERGGVRQRRGGKTTLWAPMINWFP